MKDFPLHSVWQLNHRPPYSNDWFVFVVLSVKDASRWCKVIAAANELTYPFGHAFTFNTGYAFTNYCERIA